MLENKLNLLYNNLMKNQRSCMQGNNLFQARLNINKNPVLGKNGKIIK